MPHDDPFGKMKVLLHEGVKTGQLPLKVLPQGESAEETGLRLSETLRQTDYMGILDDGQLYVLLSNTNSENAQFVVERFRESGFETLLVEEAVV